MANELLPKTFDNCLIFKNKNKPHPSPPPMPHLSSLLKNSFNNKFNIFPSQAFGFISMFVFIGDGVVHFLKMQGKM